MITGTGKRSSHTETVPFKKNLFLVPIGQNYNVDTRTGNSGYRTKTSVIPSSALLRKMVNFRPSKTIVTGTF
jgi:hypothetical protein